MKVGNFSITRDQMPSFSWAQDNPGHMYQSLQDIHRKSKQTQTTQSVRGAPGYQNDENNDMASKDAMSSVWK